MSDEDDDDEYRPLREWTWLVLRGLLYAAAIVAMLPLLALFRADPRIDYLEDMAYGGET